MSTFLTVVLAGLMLGVIYSLVGVGFGLVLWTTRIFHLAIATIYALAGYLCWQVAVVWDLGIGLGIVACLGAAILLGVAIEQFVYYPLTKRGSSFFCLLPS
jgi:branched-chain amino acid transport system permease protein